MKPTLKELQSILNRVHNVNSTSTMPPEFEFESQDVDTWFDKYVLKYF